jgi:uncharacterized protein YjeT (DUF2065 family)
LALALLPIFSVTALLLALAGVYKLVSPHAARASMAVAGLHLPSAGVRLVGAGEAALGLVAAVAPGTVTALAVAVAYGAFALFVIRLMRAGGEAGCGCFGDSEASVGPAHVAFNALACAVCLMAAALSPPGPAWVLGVSPLIAVPVVLGTGAAVYAAFLAFTGLPSAWAAYGSKSSS